ncbi:MAG: DUF4124 domain-containing protein [Burkholderiales bacterium]
MKRILVLACALAASTAAMAQLYKWVDKDGRVTYSDQPPPAQESKQLNIGGGAPTPARPSATERDKELEKSRQDAREKAKLADAAAKKAQLDEENCNRARAYLRTVTDGGRIATYDAKGERVLLDDEQIEQERVKAQKAVDESCKSS